MQADPAAQRRLLDLQELDTALSQLEHRRNALPEHAQVAALQAQRDKLNSELVAAQTIASDTEAEQAKAEADLEPVRARLARDQQAVDSGSISDPKALMPMLDEIEHLKTRIATLEDAELEVMEALEAAQARVQMLTGERAELDAGLAEATGQRDVALGELGQQIAKLTADRASVADEIPADLLALYERQRTRSGGVGVGALERGRCTGCQLQATAEDLRRYQAAAPTEVLRCEECDRLLVRAEGSA